MAVCCCVCCDTTEPFVAVCVAVCYIILQCSHCEQLFLFFVYCSVLQCIVESVTEERSNVCCSVLQCVAESVTEERSDRDYSILLLKNLTNCRCIALYCSVLQFIAVCCSVLQCVRMTISSWVQGVEQIWSSLSCSALQCFMVSGSELQ